MVDQWTGFFLLAGAYITHNATSLEVISDYIQDERLDPAFFTVWISV